MACGTGKTLLSLWVAERTKAQNILVLVPSLALLRQTLHEWTRETSWPSFANLCVCSDPTVKPDTDEIILRSSDLDFPVTTDAAHVREFLAHSYHGVKLVFSTYQSAHVVAAGMNRGNSFDLAIFDEAHKTAGREGVHFGFALNDKNLAIGKRLFLTATPRHYDVRKRDKEGDARLVYSMDRPEVYGPVAHKLTFADAARRDIICGYKVIISVVTSDMVNDHLLRHGEVIVNGDAIKARHVANQIALQAAIEKHGVSKIFTFHRSVASAAAFTGDGSEGIANHLPGFDAFHVNGAMPTSERENIMTEFRAASKAVISNAKCLTEGVDVPAVDMVAFLTPKRSRVDIVQATGRAMRKAGHKTTGYVLVPLFVEQAKGETVEEALIRTEFDEVWNVLQAMQEQDEMLAEIIREMREERGRSKGFNDSLFRDRVEFLGPQISLEALRDSITTACVQELGDKWDERFGQLKAFKEKHGHCNVPRNKTQLSSWVHLQRSRYEFLDPIRVARLESIGFLWNPHETAWTAMFSELVSYKAKYGDCNVPSNWSENRFLATWCHSQRSHKRRSTLSEERIQRLDLIGFDWNPFESEWEKHISELRRYKASKGDCNVPDRFPEYPLLGKWVRYQRTNRHKLSSDRIARLEQIGFDWNPFHTAWQESFSELEQYKTLHGDCNVPQLYPDNKALATWVANQRFERNAGRLDPERIKQLEKIGFIWDPRNASWDAMFASLVEYQREFGDCNVPVLYPQNPQLYRWLVVQRAFRKKHRLDQHRIDRLSKLGFVWDQNDSAWEAMFSSLSDYRKRFGHCNVPQRWTENPKLATWVINLRSRRGSLTAEQSARLESLDFDWNPFEAAWREMFAALKDYRCANGDCNVPSQYPKKQQLATWVTTQRAKQSKLSKERFKCLDSIGFLWAPTEALWEEMFTKLVEYKRLNGSCHVPRGYQADPSLAGWVQKQRTGRNTLTKERTQRLESIGFDFTPHQTSWQRMLARLADYNRKVGHCAVRPIDDPDLSHWVLTQRTKRKQLSIEQIRCLDELGFLWNPIQQAWNQLFDLLCEYKALNGNCNVPQRWPQNQKLANWCSNQRAFKRRGKLTKERTRRLDSIGFIFEPLASSWEEMFPVLLDYKRLHGDCNVPEDWPQNPRLGQWVKAQRRSKKSECLSELQIRRLEELGFEWQRQKDFWGKMFAALSEFQMRHGHCNVLPDSSEHEKLRFWCNNQRQLKRRGALREERIQSLDKLGFQWKRKGI